MTKQISILDGFKKPSGSLHAIVLDGRIEYKVMVSGIASRCSCGKPACEHVALVSASREQFGDEGLLLEKVVYERSENRVVYNFGHERYYPQRYVAGEWRNEPKKKSYKTLTGAIKFFLVIETHAREHVLIMDGREATDAEYARVMRGTDRSSYKANASGTYAALNSNRGFSFFR